MICPECHTTTRPNYRGACVTCLRRELDRLASLNEAYWREIDWYHKHVNPTWFGDRPEFFEIRYATDAARRAAGEAQ